MPPRQNELPEGTDHIINGAMATDGASGGGGGGGASPGGAGGGAGGASSGAAAGGGSSSGFIGATGGNDTGGTAGTSGGSLAATGGGGSGGGGSGGESGGVMEQLRDQASSLRDQGVDRVRDFATGGKTRASDALEELSRVFTDTAETIDERLGRDYGEYARKAADTVSGFADTLRRKEVDEIYDDLRDGVRKSPGVAIGIAAVLGFAVARIVKAGLTQDDGDRNEGGRSGSSGGTRKKGGTGGTGGPGA